MIIDVMKLIYKCDLCGCVLPREHLFQLCVRRDDYMEIIDLCPKCYEHRHFGLHGSYPEVSEVANETSKES